MNSLAIYIHIPYCRTLCPYCDFVREPVAGGVPGAYIRALCREIDGFDGPAAAASVFFGGGTPSLLEEHSLAAILGALHRRFRLPGAEVTLEANPDDVTPGRVGAWARLGVNRVSLGVQHFDDAALRYLGRRHDAGTALRACGRVAERFGNWSLDLIYGLPGSNAWAATLARALELAPPHIACYALTFEPGTPFQTRAQEAPEDDRVLELYQAAEQALAGYAHYEVSNFARPGFECRHNLVYWRNESYAGFGTGAYQFMDGVRARNHREMKRYLSEPGGKEEAIPLTPREARVETLIQHFRLREGIAADYYKARFGTDLCTDFGPKLDALAARGLIETADTFFRPTARGFYLNNEIGLALLD